MQSVTVAIADADRDRRARYEYSLREVPGINLLVNVASSNGSATGDRRRESRTNITIIQDEVARVKRLRPRVLLVDPDLLPESDCYMLESLRHECPETLVVLLADESGNEDLIMKALAVSARGYLNREAARSHISKVASAIDQGEVWVPRKMLGKIMDRIQNRELH